MNLSAQAEGVGEADPFATGHCGGSRRMVTVPASPSTGVTTAPASLAARPPSLSAPASPSCCERPMPMLFSYGESSLMTRSRSKRASTARSSETRGRTSRPSLSDRLTRSLITSGLVSGITPTSIRQLSGQPIRVLAFGMPAGGDAASPPEGCSSSSASPQPLTEAEGPAGTVQGSEQR